MSSKSNEPVVSPILERSEGRKPDLPYAQFFRPGMGTELVAPLLYSLVRMLRPERILEIGAGYTSAWLTRALNENASVLIDWNSDHTYFQQEYCPQFVCIDTLSENVGTTEDVIPWLKQHETVKLVIGDFRELASDLQREFGSFDFVWFDCGGPEEYEFFCSHYLPFCAGMVLLHFTYSQGQPNSNHDVITRALSQPEHCDEANDSVWSQIDLVEPHKHRQGSVTMLKRKGFRGVV